MASALFRSKIAATTNAANWLIDSAGVWTEPGHPAAEKAQEVLGKFWGIDISDHQSQCVSDELLNKFNLILTMELGQKEGLGIEFPNLKSRIFLIYEMIGLDNEVHDPYRGTMTNYYNTALELERILTEGFGQIIHLADMSEGSPQQA